MKKRLAARFLLLVFLGSLTVMALSVTFAWFSNTLSSDFGATSYVHKSYFESGDGTGALRYNTGYDNDGKSLGSDDGVTGEDGCAFEIRYPLQLYYFAWLQNLGYFNTPDETTGVLKQVHFYLSADLDMSDYELPPIGTAEHPFLGTFDGNGHTITNLHIINEESELTDVPDSAEEDAINPQIVGFFGVVGTYNGSAPASDGVASVSDMILNGVNIETSDPTGGKSLIGIAAGYVNGEMSGVAVANSTVTVASGVSALGVASSVSGGGTTNVSDYGLVGYCTEPYMLDLNVTKVTLAAPVETQNVIYKNLQNEGPGFGGSIQMETLFNRINNFMGTSYRPTGSRTSAETVVRDENDVVLSRTPTGSTNYANNNDRRYYQQDDAGSYYLYDTTANIHYMTQESKVVTTVRYTGETKNGYKISDGTRFLNLNAAANGVTTDGDATAWVFENGRIYAYSEVDGQPHYLNGNGSLTVSTTASTTNWTWTNNHFSCTYNNVTYCLRYNNGWEVAEEYYYVITDGNGNYLRVTGTTNNNATATLGNTTNLSQASHWTFTNLSGSGYISTTYGNNNTTYYLRYDNGLTATNSTNNRTNWTTDSTSIYCTSNNTRYYLRFNGTNWVAAALGTYYAIRNGTNYLNITAVSGNTATLGTGTSIADISSANGHTLWTFSTTGTNPSGTISATVNGTTYYLRDNNGTLTATTAANATSWSNSGSALYNGADYIEYSSDWHIKTVGKSIRSGNNYLNITAANGTTATLGTGNSIADNSESNHTMWAIDDNGYISASYNGTTYYLRNNNGTLTATNSTTNRTVWTQDGSAVYTGTDSNRYYLNYSNGWTLTQSTLLGYTIRSGSNYLNLTSASTSTSTNPLGNGTSVADTNDNGHTVWTFSNTGDNPSGTISATSGNTRYYIYIYRSGNMLNRQYNMRLSTSSSQNYSSWTNSDGQLYIYYGGNRYIRYNNGWSLNTTAATLSIDPVYSSSGISALTVTAGTAPSVTVTSETEPAPNTQAERISNVQTLTRANASVSVMRNDGTTNEATEYATAFPLNITSNSNSNYAASDTNTGYVVSGNTAADYGDIRISRYNASSISNSANGLSGTNSYTATYDSRLEVITAVNNGSYSGWYRVSDNKNASNSSLSTEMSGLNLTKVNYKTLGLKRYEDARASMTKTFVDSQYIYGLHFMDAAISKDHIITLPQANIEGTWYPNYEVPNDSIDFNVKRRGFITVFSGTYYNGSSSGPNTAFFSLHEITRYSETDPEVVNGYKRVTDIKEIIEISKIYKPKEGDDFIYLYTDGSYSDGKSASDCGSLAFDMVWMTNPSNFIMNAVYYFEIPVNGGEFALGSVDGKQGAYLFYLDIAANGGQAEDKDRVTVSERFTEQVYDVTLPAGVQLTAGGAYDAQRPYETVTVALANGYNGGYTFTRTGNVFTYNAATNTELTYIGGALTASNGQGTSVNYYPNGYTVTTVENITDAGRDTNLVDKTRIETVDTYDSSGALVQPRTVKVYAGVDITDNTADFVEIVSFTYDSSTHANMKTRVVRAASSGGFNIVFDQEMALTATVTNENVHVNFGNNTSNYMQTVVAADSPASLTLRSETVINMTNDEPEEVYYTAVIGPDIAAYYSYVEGGDGVERDTAPTLTTSPIAAGTTNATQSLNYAITLSSDSEIIVYATQLINTYGGTTYVENSGGTAAQSATFTVNSENTPAVVTVNGTALEKNVPKEIVIAAPQQSTP